MEIISTNIPDVLLIKPQVFGDERGFFMESFNSKRWLEATGLERTFVQDNHSRSAHGVVRGLHYQMPQPQGKLVRCLAGEIYDVAVDLRLGSPTFGTWVGAFLSAENHLQLWVPEGFAHGFAVISPSADVFYKTTAYYAPEYEKSLLWNDPELNIKWPALDRPVLSVKDQNAATLKHAECYR
ncbi:MAG: dTDP-4-dehydrorhamnose 3,5-epimerase [Desulfuromonadaceae bacterium]|nr:dTDP-4-dehydrorhamnose 3,5-epimerase [Desulfuromonas sp.]MDY0185598.1 dTDP-4-dehydrorhamnose 3,5-epimerase [Desulfuromonadaceae bacterium]